MHEFVPGDDWHTDLTSLRKGRRVLFLFSRAVELRSSLRNRRGGAPDAQRLDPAWHPVGQEGAQPGKLWQWYQSSPPLRSQGSTEPRRGDLIWAVDSCDQGVDLRSSELQVA